MNTRTITLGAMFVAIGLVLPMLFHTVGLGATFLPMHIPVLLAGLFVGPALGLMVGAITPLLSSFLTGMPPLAPPIAQAMIFELATYGFLAGLGYQRWRLGIYPTLLLAMLVGRFVYGLVGYFVLPWFGLKQIPLLYPLTYGLVSGLPGIALQLILIPGVVYLVERRGAALFALRRTPVSRG